jgi:multidrug efflux pump
MTGIGIIANAGVIVNNNIVLIDTYDRLRHEGVNAYDAIIETCRERARPVVLTAVTAILGVLAIAFGINLDFVNRDIAIGRRQHNGGRISLQRSCLVWALQPF